jgi:predicted SAM-dependent methyltransferase
MERLQYLNLGCGNRYHPDWINMDITPRGQGVIRCDLTRGIPLPDGSCDVVYHSHLLEHLRRPDALSLIKECYRVLKPGGILRVAVPDLEQICRQYLEKLDATLSGDLTSATDYDWMMLEMLDQTVREKSGGEMLAYLRQDPLPNENFVYARIGEEGRNMVRAIRCWRMVQPTLQIGWRGRLIVQRQRLRSLFGKVFDRLLARSPVPAVRTLEIGRFRLSGEVHHWMYDRYSLARLMLAAGFRDPIQQSARQSRIPQWSTFNLDTLPDDTVNKPDSIFMEAIKLMEA